MPFRGYVPVTSKHQAASLFEHIPSNRSCTEAGIRDFHCMEGKWKSVLGNVPSDYLDLPYQVIRKINRYLDKSDSDSVCQELKVRNISSLELQEKFLLSDQLNSNIHYLRSVFDTVDEGLGSVTYNAVLSYDSEKLPHSFYVLHISQLTRYRKYEACVPETIKALFCVCNASETGK